MKLALYTKAEFSLCAQAEDVVLRVRRSIQFEAEFVYIEDDEALYERYGERVPVVIVDGKEVGSGEVDEARLLAAMSSAV